MSLTVRYRPAPSNTLTTERSPQSGRMPSNALATMGSLKFPTEAQRSRHRPPWMAGMPEMQEHFPAISLMVRHRSAPQPRRADSHNAKIRDACCNVRAGGVGKRGFRTMSDMDVAIEPPRMGSRRVLNPLFPTPPARDRSRPPDICVVRIGPICYPVVPSVGACLSAVFSY